MKSNGIGNTFHVGHGDQVGKNFVVCHADGVRKICGVSKTRNVFLVVCQVLRDISCVNPSRTPKAFKGKGSALSQAVNSVLLLLAGAGA